MARKIGVIAWRSDESYIPDSFKKIVIVNGVRKPWRNDEGFVIMGMKHFLLSADSLEF